MERTQIKTKMLAYLKNYTREEIDWEEVDENLSIVDDLGVNSARFVDIVIDTEDEFDILVDDLAMAKLRTVGDFIELIQRKLEDK